jgi:predicted RNA-binding protein with PIN domain
LSARWLVDGMNVIGSRPDHWWRDRAGAMRALVERLAAFAAQGEHEVTVVFDGRPRELGATAGPVEVRFAPGGRNAADDAIARLVAADGAPQTLRVVTSDAELAARVREHGAQVASAGAFRDRIEPSG